MQQDSKRGREKLAPSSQKTITKKSQYTSDYNKTLVPYQQKHPSGAFLCLGSRILRQHTATHRNTLQRTAHCDTPQHIATHGTLQDTATHCNTLQHTATHGTLQHTAAQSNTLQHTATHCNTPQQPSSHVWVVTFFGVLFFKKKIPKKSPSGTCYE